MRTVLAALAVALASCATPVVPDAQAQPAQRQAQPPAWWMAHVDFISRDGGTWITPNPANETDPSQPDQFGMQWTHVNEGYGLVGRLYGVEGGREVGEYWTFREFWHPGERRALVQQWAGAGVFGVGESRWEDGQGVLDQAFWLPDGRSWREGHRNREDGDTYHTQAFDIDAAGAWIAKPATVWTRVRP